MSYKIGVIHATAKAIQPLNDVFAEFEPDVQVENFLNENLLSNVNKHEKVEKKDLVEFTKFLFQATDSNVDGIIIACSVFCPNVPLFNHFTDIPIVAIDKPMLEKAVDIGKKIGVVATTASAGPSGQRQLQDIAREKGKNIDTEVSIVTEAMDELKQGNVKEHDIIIHKAIYELEEKNCDTIVLAQISMATAASTVTSTAKVLTSPIEGMRKIMEDVRGNK